MYTNSQPRLKEAISLVKIGQKSEARIILREILQVEPLNEPAWMWYLDTLQSDRERLKALENYLMANPESEFARKGVNRLRELCPPTIPKPLPIKIPPDLNVQPIENPPVAPFPPEEKAPDKWLVIAVVFLLVLTVFVSIGLIFTLPALNLRSLPTEGVSPTLIPTLLP
jgi:hypothetical protein